MAWGAEDSFSARVDRDANPPAHSLLVKIGFLPSEEYDLWLAAGSSKMDIIFFNFPASLASWTGSLAARLGYSRHKVVRFFGQMPSAAHDPILEYRVSLRGSLGVAP
jgi:hypothetical protein